MRLIRRSFEYLQQGLEWLLVAVPGGPLALGAVVILIGLAAYFALRSDLPEADRLAWYGIWLGVLSFWYTVSQLYQTKRAAVAAQESAVRAAAGAYRVSLERTARHLEEVIQFVDNRLWKLAVLRLRDVAAELRRVQYQRSHADRRWETFATALAGWAVYMKEHGRDTRKLRFEEPWTNDRWAVDVQLVLSALQAELSATGQAGDSV
ncbi:MAG: hypothetical protein K2P78_14935 [Gemmataceae bacterium]|nr:hypothetical protein [Gemmataceae bacterium]